MAAHPQDRPVLQRRVARRAFPEVLLRWRELSGEAFKCAIELWHRVCGEPGPLEICYSELGPALGGSESAARRWLAALARQGLVRRISGQVGPSGGTYWHVYDPDEVYARRNLARVGDDPQRELPFADDEPDPPQVVQFVASDGGTDGGTDEVVASDVETDELTPAEGAYFVASDGGTAGGTDELTPPKGCNLVASDVASDELRDPHTYTSKKEINNHSPPPPPVSPPPPPLAAADDAEEEEEEEEGRLVVVWGEVERALRLAGVGAWQLLAAQCRRNGLAPREVVAVVAYWADQQPAWDVGALFRKLQNHAPGTPVERGWPPRSEAARCDADRRRRAQQQAQRAEDREQAAARRRAEEAKLAALEARHGPTLERLARDDLLALVRQACPMLERLAARDGLASSLVRERLLLHLSDHPPT